MLSTAIVIFREILEIALIISVVMVATKNMPGRNKWVGIGIIGGMAGSALIAVFAQTISQAAEGLGQELFNAAILLTAATVIGGTALWMSKHARAFTQQIRDLGSQVLAGNAPLYSIAVVIMLAILREGAEIILFTYGMLASGISVTNIILGSIIGFAGGAALGGALYAGLVSISPRHVFSVTTWILILLCAGLAATAAKFLSSAGWFEALSYQIWDTSFILSDGGIIGQTLHALLGYTAKPLAVQVVFYGVALGGLLVARWVINSKSRSIHTMN